MADILIRGMEMPKSCIDCPIMVDRYDTDACALQSEEANEAFESWEDMRRNCPLVPLLEGQGRLKDSRYIIDTIKGTYCSACVCSSTSFNCQLCKITKVIEIIENAQTIVPAEGRTDPPPKSVAQRWVVTDTGWKCPFCGGEIDAEIQWLVSPEFPKYCPQCGKRLVL